MKPAAAWKALKKHASAKDGAWKDHPWGETVYKVGKKVFVFLGTAEDGYGDVLQAARFAARRPSPCSPSPSPPGTGSASRAG